MNNSKYWAMIAQNAANITDTDALRRILAQAEAARDAAIEADSDATRQAEMADSDARAAARVIVETDSDARAAEMFRDQAQTLANNAAQSAIDARGDAMAAAGSAAEAATDAGDADAAASRAANSARTQQALRPTPHNLQHRQPTLQLQRRRRLTRQRHRQRKQQRPQPTQRSRRVRRSQQTTVLMTPLRALAHGPSVRLATPMRREPQRTTLTTGRSKQRLMQLEIVPVIPRSGLLLVRI